MVEGDNLYYSLSTGIEMNENGDMSVKTSSWNILTRSSNVERPRQNSRYFVVLVQLSSAYVLCSVQMNLQDSEDVACFLLIIINDEKLLEILIIMS